MNESQPQPRPGRQVVADRVLLDIQTRIEEGQERYGTKLETFNGRDALWDAYEEAIDLVFYLRQAIMEREAAARCKWKLETGGVYYDTGCDNAFEFSNGDPSENNFEFCPYCGRGIEEEPQ